MTRRQPVRDLLSLCTRKRQQPLTFYPFPRFRHFFHASCLHFVGTLTKSTEYMSQRPNPPKGQLPAGPAGSEVRRGGRRTLDITSSILKTTFLSHFKISIIFVQTAKTRTSKPTAPSPSDIDCLT